MEGRHRGGKEAEWREKERRKGLTARETNVKRREVMREEKD